jgi:hypothetical protein
MTETTTARSGKLIDLEPGPRSTVIVQLKMRGGVPVT